MRYDTLFPHITPAIATDVPGSNRPDRVTGPSASVRCSESGTTTAVASSESYRDHLPGITTCLLAFRGLTVMVGFQQAPGLFLGAPKKKRTHSESAYLPDLLQLKWSENCPIRKQNTSSLAANITAAAVATVARRCAHVILRQPQWRSGWLAMATQHFCQGKVLGVYGGIHLLTADWAPHAWVFHRSATGRPQWSSWAQAQQTKCVAAVQNMRHQQRHAITSTGRLCQRC